MMGALGAICIALGFGSLWYLQLLSQGQKLDTLGQLASSMLEICSEIQSHQTPLPRIFQNLSQHYTGKTGALYHAVSQEIEEGNTLLDSWMAGVEAIGFPPEETSLLLQTGRSFVGNEEQICKVLNLASDCFEREISKIKEQLPNERRSCGALCVSGGALLLILLL